MGPWINTLEMLSWFFFGDPTTKGAKEDALSCVKMALEMQKQVLGLSGEWG